MTDLSERIRHAFTAVSDGVPGAVDRFLVAVHTFAVRYCRAALGREETGYVGADHAARQICHEVRLALPRMGAYSRSVLAFVYSVAARMTTPGRHHRSPPRRHDPAGRMAGLVSHLPSAQREIIILRLVVGFSAEDTAEALGSTADAVRRSQHLALTRLRGHIARR